MGLLAQRLEEVRNDTGWLTRDDGEELAGAITGSGVRVNARTALGLTTIWRCVDLLSSAVSQAPKDVTLKVGGQSFEQYSKPSWLSLPNPNDPTYTINDYFSQIGLSMLVEGNYFVWVIGTVFDPRGLIVLSPSRVVVRDGPLYDIKDASGRTLTTLGPYDILHGTWIRPPGELRGISPLENLRRTIGGAVAAEEFAGRFFGQGASLSFGVEVPTEMDPNKKEDLRQSLKRRHAGLGSSHAIGVLTGGAKFVAGLAPTPEQSQMLETRMWAVEDLCRPYGVPPAMAGSQQAGAASFASTDTYDRWFKERGCLPLASRIESQHERLLQVPVGLPDGATMQFRFNLDAVARVDLLERFQAYGEGVTKGIFTPNEARGKEDLPPIDGGDELYMQQQMVPISKLGQTKATEPLDTQRSIAAAEDEERRHVELMAIASRQPQISVPVNVTTPPVHVDGAQVTVQPAEPAQVHVDGAQVNIAPPAITLEPAAVQVDVHVPPQRPMSKSIERDAKGQITSIVEKPDGE